MLIYHNRLLPNINTKITILDSFTTRDDPSITKLLVIINGLSYSITKSDYNSLITSYNNSNYNRCFSILKSIGQFKSNNFRARK